MKNYKKIVLLITCMLVSTSAFGLSLEANYHCISERADHPGRWEVIVTEGLYMTLNNHRYNVRGNLAFSEMVDVANVQLYGDKQSVQSEILLIDGVRTKVTVRIFEELEVHPNLVRISNKWFHQSLGTYGWDLELFSAQIDINGSVHSAACTPSDVVGL